MLANETSTFIISNVSFSLLQSTILPLSNIQQFAIKEK